MKNLKTAPTRSRAKDKQLHQRLDRAVSVGLHLAEENAELEKKLYATEHAFKRICEANAETSAAKAQLQNTAQMTAAGLLLERDELLTRVRRIEFRVQGLGYEVR
jgi:hypothetical protein